MKLVEIKSQEVEIPDAVIEDGLSTIARISYELISNDGKVFSAKIHIEAGFEPMAIFLMNFTFVIEHTVSKKITQKEIKKELIKVIQQFSPEYSFYVSTISNLMFGKPFIFPPFFTDQELKSIRALSK